MGVSAVLHDLAAAELATTHQHGDLVGEAREEGRLLERRVAAAHDRDVSAAEEEPVAGRARAHAAAAERLFGGQAQPQGRCARRNDDGIGAVLDLADPDPERAFTEVDLGRIALHQRGAESLGLLAEHLHQLRALDTLRETGVVLHVGGDHQLTHRNVAGDHERLEVGPRGIDGGGQPGRP